MRERVVFMSYDFFEIYTILQNHNKLLLFAKELHRSLMSMNGGRKRGQNPTSRK